jgi:hypothetical protein
MFDHRNSDGRIRIGANGTFLAEATRVGSGPGSQTFFNIGPVRLNQPNYYVDELRVSHNIRY